MKVLNYLVVSIFIVLRLKISTSIGPLKNRYFGLQLVDPISPTKSLGSYANVIHKNHNANSVNKGNLENLKMNCLEGFHLDNEGFCTIIMRKKPYMSCPLGTFMNPDFTCTHIDAVIPKTFCPPGFEKYLKGCLRRITVPSTHECPEGYISLTNNLCGQLIHIAMQPHCPVDYALECSITHSEKESPCCKCVKSIGQEMVECSKRHRKHGSYVKTIYVDDPSRFTFLPALRRALQKESLYIHDPGSYEKLTQFCLTEIIESTQQNVKLKNSISSLTMNPKTPFASKAESKKHIESEDNKEFVVLFTNSQDLLQNDDSQLTFSIKSCIDRNVDVEKYWLDDYESMQIPDQKMNCFNKTEIRRKFIIHEPIKNSTMESGATACSADEASNVRSSETLIEYVQPHYLCPEGSKPLVQHDKQTANVNLCEAFIVVPPIQFCPHDYHFKRPDYTKEMSKDYRNNPFTLVNIDKEFCEKIEYANILSLCPLNYTFTMGKKKQPTCISKKVVNPSPLCEAGYVLEDVHQLRDSCMCRQTFRLLPNLVDEKTNQIVVCDIAEAFQCSKQNDYLAAYNPDLIRHDS